MKFTKSETQKIKEYFDDKRMFISKHTNELDCQFSNCTSCVFHDGCIVGGTEEDVFDTRKMLKKTVPEYLL